MKIERQVIPEMTIQEFADKHELTMRVNERPKPIGSPDRFYASFVGAEIMDGGCLVGMFGDGATEEDAITAYARRIELRTLVIDAMGSSRRAIPVPRLWVNTIAK
jgi:hypothetical protein